MPSPRCHPFDLHDHAAYRYWRDYKLANYVTDVAALITPVADAAHISADEWQSLQASCSSNNFCFYHSDTELTHSCVPALGARMKLTHVVSNLYADDQGVSEVRVSTDHRQQKFIPYTRRSLNWHTDGYYQPVFADNAANHTDGMIQSFILHCAASATSGGENHLLDHEIAYILLRDQNPDYISAMMNPEAMTIPANRSGHQTVRESVTGPVFAVTANGHLWMRYTARERSVLWYPDPVLDEARAALTDLLENSAYIIKHTLSPGQGMICNNVLHNRTSFEECGQQNRLLYRIRYLDRVDTQIAMTAGHDTSRKSDATKNQV